MKFPRSPGFPPHFKGQKTITPNNQEINRTSRNNLRVKQEITALTGLNLGAKIRPANSVVTIVTNFK